MSTTLANRVAIITGAARGIGRATAAAMLVRGAKVAALDCDADELAVALREIDQINGGLTIHVCDVSDAAAVTDAVESILLAHGRIDVLINNAAIVDETPLVQLTPQRMREVMAINFDGALHCTRACLPFLRKSDAASIVNIASTQGLRGQPNAIAYSAAKAAIISLTRTLAVDLGPEGIRVNAVAPGFIDTRMAVQASGQHEHHSEWFHEVYLKHGRLPLRRAGQPDDVAGPIIFLASDDSRYITGQVIVVDGGLTCTY